MDQRKASRRSFLAGGLGRAERGERPEAAVRTGGPEHPLDSIHDSPSNYLEHYSTSAMGCQFEVFVPYQRFHRAASAALEIFDELERLEDIMSVYRPASELSQVNAAPAGTWRPVSDDLYAVLELARSIAELTDGAFDPTARPLSHVWGFSHREGKIPDAELLQRALENVGHRYLQLDRGRQAVRKQIDALTIDLGAIGKGYALDRCRDRLLGHGISDVVVHGGQSSVVALGSETEPATNDATDSPDPMPGWTIGVSHPLIPNHRLGTIRLHNQALATSGSGRQGFIHAGRRYGHVIDPRTGWPPDRFLSVTVVAQNSAECDALATAFFVMSPAEIERVCDVRRDVGVILVHRPESGSELRVQSFNLPPDQWQPNTGARQWKPD